MKEELNTSFRDEEALTVVNIPDNVLAKVKLRRSPKKCYNEISDDGGGIKSEPTATRNTLNDLLLFESDYTPGGYEVKNTINYFDESLGTLKNREEPTSVEFACALLREVLVALTESSVLREKVKLGALMLHLSTATEQFDWLYKYYHQIECDVLEGQTDWLNYQVDLGVEENLTNRARDGNCFFDQSIFHYKTLLMEVKVEERTQQEDDMKENAAESDFDPMDYTNDDWTETKVTTVKKPRKKRIKKVNESKVSVPKPAVKKRGRKKLEATEKPYLRTCEICQKEVNGVKALSIHMFDEHSHGTLCTQCGHPSATYQEYEKHMSIHLLNCDVCEFTCVGLNRLRRHQNTHQIKGVKAEAEAAAKVPCYVCGVELKEASLPNHLYTAHPDVSNGTVYKCDKCDYTTLSKFSISSHKKSHSLQLQECPVCKRKVKYLSKHIKRGNCVNKKEPIPCELCDKVFTDKWHVKRHVKIVHMQVKDISCDMCEYRTYTSFNLRVHKSKMHTKESLETHCEICNKKTMSIEHHMKTFHFDVFAQERDHERSLDFLNEDKKLEQPAMQEKKQLDPLPLYERKLDPSHNPNQLFGLEAHKDLSSGVF